MNREKDINLIDAYLREQLDNSERNAFEVRLQKEDAFKTLFEEQQIIQGAIRLRKREDLLQQLEGFESEFEDQEVIPTKSLSVNWQRWLAVAAVGLLFAVAAFFLIPRETNTDQYTEIVKEYFVPYPYDGLTRSDLTPKEKEAYIAYNREDYKKAIVLFEGTSAPIDLFYQGNAHLAAGDSEKAIGCFENFLKEESPYRIAAQYYLALAYLQTKKIKKAKQILQKLSLEKHSYAAKAKMILEKLKI